MAENEVSGQNMRERNEQFYLLKIPATAHILCAVSFCAFTRFLMATQSVPLVAT